MLAGKYSDLVELVNTAYCDYTIHHIRRNERHCRELMRAYVEICAHTEVDLDDLETVRKNFGSTKGTAEFSIHKTA